MKKIGLFCLFSLVLISAFAAFPVATQAMLAEVDPEKFKLDAWGFIIGILTFPLLFIYGLPFLLLFVNKKHFRGSLAWGWLAGFVLIIFVIVVAFAEPEFQWAY